MGEITAVVLRRLEVPLTEPYRLSHTTVETLDIVLCQVQLADGRMGIGEATPLTGYSGQSIVDLWGSLTEVAEKLPGHDIVGASERVAAALGAFPFARSAIDCAIETAQRTDIPPVSAPIVGILSTDVSVETARDALAVQVKEGFKTVKVKIGFDPARDARRLAALASAAPTDVSFRVDANQGYTLPEARTFLDRAPIDRLQLIEQPLPVGTLHEHAALTGEYDLRVMLDEEVRGPADIRAIADAGAADAVKFKLMKLGGWNATRSAIEKGRRAGFEIVLGNGVQSDVGCLHEATLWSEAELDLAGEFNGWRKQRHSLADRGPEFGCGSLHWNGGDFSLNEERLEHTTAVKRTFGHPKH